MGEITKKIGRELCVYVSRGCEILYLSLGEGDRADLADIRLRRSENRLSGLRCIHTLPAAAVCSPRVIESLKKLRFDAMCAIGVDENGTTDVSAAVLDQSEQGFALFTAKNVSAIPQEKWLCGNRRRRQADSP